MTNDELRLIADIGGTHARFALAQGEAVRAEAALASADFPGPLEAARRYLDDVKIERGRLREAAFAVAAPIAGADRIDMTNLAWRFSVSDLRRALGLQRLIVLNDFTALAMSVRHLPATELVQVAGAGSAPRAPIAVLGPGTGLGVSGLIPTGDHWVPLQGEGGHVSLAPGNEREAALLQQLRRRFGHVSAERAISGPGLVNLYETICAVDGKSPENVQPEEIMQRAVDARCPSCAEALQTFCALLGSVTGDLVLTLGALGGVYLGGGILPRMPDYFLRSPFHARYLDKGRYRDYLAPVPIRIVTTPNPAFVGLAHAFDTPGPRLESLDKR
ncbi:MAG: glucokinase [Gammaproteobacteria bacterium]|nr:glucokinase [Gammaproteobacteria bacterium]